MTPRYIHDGPHLRATVLGDHADKLIVTYDHWGASKADFQPPRARSSYVELGFTHLHLATRVNDWFVNPDLSVALEAIATFAERFAHKATLAFSMGGFGALMLSRMVDFDQVLLVSPHSTFSPVYPPHDTRFASVPVADEDAATAYAIILDSPKPRADCVVIYDSTAPFDSDHAAAAQGAFLKARAVDLKGGGHPATQLITDNKRFTVIQRAITGARIDEDRIKRVHARLSAAG